MPLKATTVRFDEIAFALVQDEAERAGMTTAQFIREAALIRAVLRARGGPSVAPAELVESIHAVSDRVIALAAVEKSSEGG